MRKVKLIFFKPSGKYYTEEENAYPEDWAVFKIVEHIELTEHHYKGMFILLQFDPNDDIGYPCLIIPERRVNNE
jgi:hypothetical protein